MVGKSLQLKIKTFCHEVVVLANGHKLTEFEQTQKLPLYPVRGQVSQIPTSENLLKTQNGVVL